MRLRRLKQDCAPMHIHLNPSLLPAYEPAHADIEILLWKEGEEKQNLNPLNVVGSLLTLKKILFRNNLCQKVALYSC